MGSQIGSTLVVLILMAPTVGSADNRREDAPVIRIRVYDHVRLSSSVLEQTQRETSSILRKVGLETTWHTCFVSGAEPSTDPECKERRSPMDLFLRLFPREMAARINNDPSIYAWSSPGDNQVFGYRADVFYHRIEVLATQTGAPCSLLLGLFVAHEIGHLLLGSNSHSKSGIMHIPYDRMQMRKAFAGTLQFTRSEARRIRAAVMKRADATTALNLQKEP